MTDKEILEAGYKYQVGDVVMGKNGDIEAIGSHNVGNYNDLDLAKADWHVVYAAALENDQQKPDNDRLDRYVQAALTGLCANSSDTASAVEIARYATIVGYKAMKAVDND